MFIGAHLCFHSGMSRHFPSSFVRTVPQGDTIERMVCGQCGWIHYENPKVVVHYHREVADVLGETKTSGLLLRDQIGRASCRERV